MTKKTLELVAGDRVILPGGRIGTVEGVVEVKDQHGKPMLSTAGNLLYHLNYSHVEEREGCIPWGRGNLTNASAVWGLWSPPLGYQGSDIMLDSHPKGWGSVEGGGEVAGAVLVGEDAERWDGLG